MKPERPENRISKFIPSDEVPSGLNRKTDTLTKPVYVTLAAHQRAEDDWDYQPVIESLACWWQIINAEFNLQLPRTALRLDDNLRTNCAGYFRPGYNEFGVEMEIAIGVPPIVELASLDLGETLGTLAHEMLHLDQELNGKPGKNNYHNRKYQQKAAALGLIVDGKGHQSYDPDGQFIALLLKHGIDLPWTVQVMQAVAAGLMPPPRSLSKSKKESKLKKWSCGCQNARVGTKEFHATCTLCTRPFVQVP